MLQECEIKADPWFFWDWVQGSGFSVWSYGLKVWDLGSGVSGAGFKVSGLGFGLRV